MTWSCKCFNTQKNVRYFSIVFTVSHLFQANGIARTKKISDVHGVMEWSIRKTEVDVNQEEPNEPQIDRWIIPVEND